MIAVAIVAVIGLVVGAVALRGDDDSDEAGVTPDSIAQFTSPSPSASSTDRSTAPAPDVSEAPSSEPDSTDGTGDDEAPSASPPRTIAPMGTDPVDIILPMPPAVGDAESASCSNVKQGMIAYRELAASSPISAFLELQLGLEEFENVADFVGQGQDWGVRMVEQLTLVRRDWSTAYTADSEGDAATATARLAAALGYLDAAIDVPCPED